MTEQTTDTEYEVTDIALLKFTPFELEVINSYQGYVENGSEVDKFIEQVEETIINSTKQQFYAALSIAAKYVNSDQYKQLIEVFEDEQSSEGRKQFVLNRAATLIQDLFFSEIVNELDDGFIRFILNMKTLHTLIGGFCMHDGRDSDQTSIRILAILCHTFAPVHMLLEFFEVAFKERTSLDEQLHLAQFIKGAFFTKVLKDQDKVKIEFHPSNEYDYYCLSITNVETGKATIAKPGDIVFFNTGEVLDADDYDNQEMRDKVLLHRYPHLRGLQDNVKKDSV